MTNKLTIICDVINTKKAEAQGTKRPTEKKKKKKKNQLTQVCLWQGNKDIITMSAEEQVSLEQGEGDMF